MVYIKRYRIANAYAGKITMGRINEKTRSLMEQSRLEHEEWWWRNS